MRPRTIFYLLFVIDCFLLVMMVAPGVSRPKSLLAAEVEYAQSPNAETKQEVEMLKADRKMKQTWLCGGAVAVSAVMLAYGWRNKARI